MSVNIQKNLKRAHDGGRALDAYANGVPINEEVVIDAITDILHSYNRWLGPGFALTPNDALALVVTAARHYATEVFKGED